MLERTFERYLNFANSSSKHSHTLSGYCCSFKESGGEAREREKDWLSPPSPLSRQLLTRAKLTVRKKLMRDDYATIIASKQTILLSKYSHTNTKIHSQTTQLTNLGHLVDKQKLTWRGFANIIHPSPFLPNHPKYPPFFVPKVSIKVIMHHHVRFENCLHK